MLAGRNDVATVAYYAKQMREYSEDGKTLNGAYGYRWRNQLVNVYEHGDPTWQHVDQLDVLVAHLKADPTSRRAVLQMWNVEDDLLKIGTRATWIRGLRYYALQGRLLQPVGDVLAAGSGRASSYRGRQRRQRRRTGPVTST
jgi:hypothetical protein